MNVLRADEHPPPVLIVRNPGTCPGCAKPGEAGLSVELDLYLCEGCHQAWTELYEGAVHVGWRPVLEAWA